MKLIRLILCALALMIGWCGSAQAKDWEDEWWCPNAQVYNALICGNSMSGSLDATFNAADTALRSYVIDYGYNSYRQYRKLGKRGPCELSAADWPRYYCTYSIIFTNIYNYNNELMNEYESEGSFYMNMVCGPPLHNVFIGPQYGCVSKGDIEPPICIPCLIGNPISPLDGMKHQSETVLNWGRGHSVVASYNALRESIGDPLVDAAPHSFGKVWFSNLHKYGLYTVTPEGAGGTMFSRGAGQFSAFTSATPALEKDPAPVVAATSGLIYRYFDTTLDAMETYEAQAVSNKVYRLKRVDYIDGRSLTHTYVTTTMGPSAVTILQSVADESGRTVQFGYERIANREHVVRLKSMVDPAGGTYGFGYTGFESLSSISFPDGTSKSFNYDFTSKPWLITSTIDENGDVFGRYAYDPQGRAISTKTGSNGPEWQVEWNPGPQFTVEETLNMSYPLVSRRISFPTATVALIHGPDGSEETMSSTQISGATLLAGRSYPAGSGYAASATQFEYDTAGNVVRRLDENGTQTCASFLGGRHAESVRVEGLVNGTTCSTVLAANAALPTGARKVSSLWHPVWRKQVRIAEPNRITTLVYNGQPDPTNGNAVASCAPSTAVLPDNSKIVVLCKRVEQATTDATGALAFSAVSQVGVTARTSSWTYDAQGHVLTETDPLGKITTNEYYTDTTADHWIGDLKSSTNAAGHVTNYLRYNALGQLLEVVDPNGISTVYTYDARSRVTSVTQGDQTTGYTYWPTGLVKQITQPDGSTVAYEYDDAHRLTAVADNLGNRIQYTLDQRGNRTNEAVKDPSGTLQRSLGRVFDALSRTQQTTGGE